MIQRSLAFLSICSALAFTTNLSAQSGTALEFDSSDDRVTCPAVPTFNLSGDYTLEAWVRPDAAGVHHAILGRGASTNPQQNLLFLVWADGRLALNHGTSPWVYATTPLPVGEWSHVAVVKTPGSYEFFLNGFSDGTGAHPGQVLANGTYPLVIGKQGQQGNEFGGVIDEVRIWDNTRSQAQIQGSMGGISDPANQGSLKAYYRFEGTDQNVTDSSSSGMHGFLGTDATVESTDPVRAPALAGDFGCMLEFDGVDDLVTGPSGGLLDLPGTYTLEAWVRPDALGTYQTILARGSGNGNPADYLFTVWTDGRISLKHGNLLWLHSASSISAEEWNHVAVVKTLGSYTFYLNGVVDGASGSTPNALGASTDPLQLGKQGSSANYFDGRLDEVRIWNVARSQAQIQAAALGLQNPASESNLVACYQFEGEGQQVTDSSANGLHASLGVSGLVEAQDPERTAAPRTLHTGTDYWGQNGGMFELRATESIVVRSFDIFLMGTTTGWDVEIYVLTASNTPYLPSVTNPGAWTLVGTATGLITNGAPGPNQMVPVPIDVDILIPAGEIRAFYLTQNNPAYSSGMYFVPSGPAGQVHESTAELECLSGHASAYPFLGVVPDFTPSCTVHYNAACEDEASTSFYGTGCYGAPRMVSEWFPSGTTPIDLINTSWTATYSGGVYTITPGGPAFDRAGAAAAGTNIVQQPPSSTTQLGNWDDASLVVSLPASFGAGLPYPNQNGATVSDLTINSNGKVMLGAMAPSSNSWWWIWHGANSGLTPRIFEGGVGPGLPTWAGFMCDLDPQAGGAIWYEDSSPNGGVRVTWDDVFTWQEPGGPAAMANDIQIELLPSGTVHLSFGPNLGNSGTVNDAITGFSAGGGQPELRLDWSAITNHVTGTGRVEAKISTSAPPRIGSTIDVRVDDLSSTTVFGGVIYGFTKYAAGLPLQGTLGVPCNLHCSLDLVVLGGVIGASFSDPLTLPPNPALAGAKLYAQGLGLDLAISNPLNAFLSNAVEMTIDN